MQKANFLKCFALFLFTTGFLYGVGETYNVSWLAFRFLGQFDADGFYFSFSSLIPVFGGLLMVGLYETIAKRFSFLRIYIKYLQKNETVDYW